jgi:hypothetical protein
MNDKFKFPDEQDTAKSDAAEDSLDIVVEDDTPPEDRGRTPLPKDIVDELDKDDLEEYSDKVKKRLSQMKKVWHDERREKERASREREEALRFAQTQSDEVKRLKQRLGDGEKVFISEVTKAATTEVETAKNKLKQAYEAGDSELIANAQEAMTDAKLKLREYERYKPSLQDDNSDVERSQQTAYAPATAKPDSKAESWREKNTWFGADEEMTALALGLHEKLVKSGVDPRTDDYYRQVDKTMRRRFPEYFGTDEQTAQNTDREEKPASRKNSTVVAPATRSTAPRQIRLTPTQVALAKRFGLSNEQYARELMKLENNNG